MSKCVNEKALPHTGVEGSDAKLQVVNALCLKTLTRCISPSSGKSTAMLSPRPLHCIFPGLQLKRECNCHCLTITTVRKVIDSLFYIFKNISLMKKWKLLGTWWNQDAPALRGLKWINIQTSFQILSFLLISCLCPCFHVSNSRQCSTSGHRHPQLQATCIEATTDFVTI